MGSAELARGPAPARAGAPPASAARAEVYLQPGLLHAAAAPTAIVTILGSCVSACLWDPVARVGGMNHFLLPHPVRGERGARFGAAAMEELVAALRRLGATPAGLRARVYGGAAVLGGRAPGRRSLGEQNGEVALAVLRGLGIPVVEGDLGGSRGRRILFHTDDGSAVVRVL